MIVRGLLVFAGLAIVAVAAAWFAETPGQVSIVWRGYRIDTSVGILAGACIVLAGLSALLFALWRSLWTLSERRRAAREQRRLREGFTALTNGFVAVAAGDAQEAKRLTRRAHALLREPALIQLLASQAAQLDGDDAAARRYFTGLLEAPGTEFFGVRGLLTLAEQEGDADAAMRLALRAEALRPKVPWVHEKLFGLEVEAGRWSAAERTVSEAIKHKTLEAATGKRRRAVVLLEQSRRAEAEDDRALAIKLARRALDNAPELTPASLSLAGLLHETSEDRRARKVVEEAWARAPHPALARLYAALAADGDAMKQLKAVDALAQVWPDDPASHLALGWASLEAKLWGEARRHLQAAGGEHPSAPICRLMAALEEAENGDTPAARAWYARAGEAEPGPGWVCGGCGAVAEGWSAVCANCGAFDELIWGTPPRVSALPAGDAVEIASGSIAGMEVAPTPGSG
ncbi:MAG: heme biosynthesis protein HemY [Alphaproteobacteria bacterium]